MFSLAHTEPVLPHDEQLLLQVEESLCNRTVDYWLKLTVCKKIIVPFPYGITCSLAQACYVNSLLFYKRQ